MHTRPGGQRYRSKSELVFQTYAVVSLVSTSGLDVLLILTLFILGVTFVTKLWTGGVYPMPRSSNLPRQLPMLPASF